MNQIIMHMDLDTFFVSVERLQNSSLQNKPVIIGGKSDRAVVASCSYEVRKYGVHAGMPLRTAQILCPEAMVINGDIDNYCKHSATVTQIIAEKAPVFEKASIDEHYLDLTGMDRFFSSQQWATELRNKIITETGLPISFGLSVNKTVSKIATGEAKPNGQLHIQAPYIGTFMHPLSVRKIPMVGQKTYKQLSAMGIQTIGILCQVPRNLMHQAFGTNGITLLDKANGIDPTPVRPYIEQKSISKEHTYEQDTANMAIIRNSVSAMVEKLAFKLRTQKKVTACVSVKIRYNNFDTHSIQQKIPYTAFDHKLRNVAMALLDKLYTRRMMIRLVGVKFSKLVHGTEQLNLFDNNPDLPNLYAQCDLLRKKFGTKCIGRASHL